MRHMTIPNDGHPPVEVICMNVEAIEGVYKKHGEEFFDILMVSGDRYIVPCSVITRQQAIHHFMDCAT